MILQNNSKQFVPEDPPPTLVQPVKQYVSDHGVIHTVHVLIIT